MMTTKDKMREQIAKILAFQVHANDKLSTVDEVWEWCKKDKWAKVEFIEKADDVLAIPGLRVEAEDQTPPSNPIIRREGNMLAFEVAERMRDYMLVPDAEGRRWVKVEPK